MGLLVGNTTVIEHAGTYIEYSRTHSHVKYAPEKLSIGFVLPKGISLSDGYFLARAIVNAQLGLKVGGIRKADELCQTVFGQSIEDFAHAAPPRKVMQPPAGYARHGYASDDEYYDEYGDDEDAPY